MPCLTDSASWCKVLKLLSLLLLLLLVPTRTRAEATASKTATPDDDYDAIMKEPPPPHALAKLDATLQRFLQQNGNVTTPGMDNVMDNYQDTSGFKSKLLNPQAGWCLGGPGEPRTGEQLQEIINCDSVPVALETDYNLLTLTSIVEWLNEIQVEINEVFEDYLGIPILDVPLAGSDLAFAVEPPGATFPVDQAQGWLEQAGLSDEFLGLDLDDLPGGQQITPVCLVCNNNMFAIRFFPGLPTGFPCQYRDGFNLIDIVQYNLAVRLKFAGVGVAWGGTNSMVYGTARNTKQNADNAPRVYDGLAQIPITVENVNFWLSFNINFINLARHKAGVAKCLGNPMDQKPKVKGSKFSFRITVDFYLKASQDELCILLVMPVAVIRGFGFIPTIDVGAAIGGYCRLPNDRCTPDGFFVNVNAAPKLPSLPTGILGSIFNGEPGDTNLGSIGGSLGFFLDKETGQPVGGLIRVFFNSPRILGLALGGSLSLEFQYISSEEFERRRDSITTTNINDQSAICSRYKDCNVWKRYKLVDAEGNERVDSKGDPLYPDRYICASVLEDTSEDTGVGNFNRKLFAKVPVQEKELRNSRNPSPTEWHVQDFFRGYDMFVVYFGVEFPIGIPFVAMASVEFTLILFGNIQPAVDPSEEFPNDAYREAACLAAAENDRLFVYMEIEASLSVASLITFDGRIMIANVPEAPGSDLTLPDNANRWILSAFADLFFLGIRFTVTVDAEWIYIDEENARRRLQEDVCADVTRRLSTDPGHWHRSLQESVGITDAPIEYSVWMSCDGVLDCLEDIGKFVLDFIQDAVQWLVKGLEKLVEFAEKAFNALADFVGGVLDYLGIDLVGAFEDIWEGVGNAWNSAVARIDASISDGFQFKDLVEIGAAILRGAAEAVAAFFKGVLGLLGIGFGVERSLPRIEVGITVFDCTKWQNRVEKCGICLPFLGCAFCRVENDGPVYVDQPCLEVAAEAAAKGQEKRDEVDGLSKAKFQEEEVDNKGFYTYVQDKCQGDNAEKLFEECRVTKPAFSVRQRVTRLESKPSSIAFSGSQLQGNSAEPLENQTQEYANSLNFGDTPSECDPDSDQFDPDALEETNDGIKICKSVKGNIGGWFDSGEAGRQAANFAQGTAKGTNSTVSTKFVTEVDWSPPSIEFANGDDLYYLEVGCDDPIVLVDGEIVNNDLLRLAKMQEFALETAGVEITLDPNIASTNVTGRWTMLEWLRSCSYQTFVQNYTVSDMTGKVSNPLNFAFRVNIVAPEIILSPPPGTAEHTACFERGSVNPFVDNSTSLLQPQLSGGCYPSVFNQVTFVDKIATSTSEGQCSVKAISREWTLRPPTANGTEAYDQENFDNEQCASLLASLVTPVQETITLCDDEEEYPVIPEQCLNSPLRFAGFEDLYATGLPKLDILSRGIFSLQTDDALYTSYSRRSHVARIVSTSNVYDIELVSPHVVRNSFKVLNSNGVESIPLLEPVFYLDDNIIRHQAIPPWGLTDYTDLCQQDTKIIAFKVRARKRLAMLKYGKSKGSGQYKRVKGSKTGTSESSKHMIRNLKFSMKSLKKGGMKSMKSLKKGDKKNKMKSSKSKRTPAGPEYHLCFQAVCGSRQSQYGMRHLLERDEHIRLLQQDSITFIKPSVEDVMQKLEHSPYIDVHQRAKEEIARNREKRRRRQLKEEQRLQDSAL